MIKRLLLILCYAFALTGYAQQGVLKEGVNVESFPEVSFVWNEYNPNMLNANQFTVKEDGREIAFTVENFVADSIPQKNKTILFLWEDQPVRENQYNFTASLLYYFLNENVLKDLTTTFNVAVFNQKQDNESVLKTKYKNFTSDKGVLKKFVSETVTHDKTRFKNSPEKSDLLLAIEEGLELIEQEPKENVRAIVVITAGLFFDGEKQPIINRALENKIPIYVVYYPAPKGESKNVEQLAKKTYGQFIVSDGSDEGNAKATRNELFKIFNNLNQRHYGLDYKITFTSQLKRDGNLHSLALNYNGTDNKIEPYRAPDFSLLLWTKENLILCLILLVIFLAAITFGIIFGIKFHKKKKFERNEQKQEEERKRVRQQADQEALKRKLNETQETVKRQQNAAEQQKRQVQEQEQEEKLAKLMQTKNLQPRLIVVNSNEMFNISNVTTTIGRNEENDIVLFDSTVSKYHAKIVFNGYNFEIYDLQSANGVVINRQYIEDAELKNGDMIQLGDTIIKFYT